MKIRFKLYIVLIVLFTLLWITYLFVVQNLDPHNFSKIIHIRQHPSKQILIPYRGNIYDKNGELLVSSVKYYQIDIDRTKIIKKPEFKKTLNSICEIIAENTSLSGNYLKKQLFREPLNKPVYISDNISENQFAKISNGFSQQNIPGLIKTFSKMKRLYPKSDLCDRLLGTIKFYRDDIGSIGIGKSITYGKGLCGIEATYNEELSGKFGWKEVINDANNRQVPLLYLKERDPEDGNSIILTIDSKFQEILEENLRNGLTEYQAKNAIGIIMEAETGKIRAMSGISLSDKYKSSANIRAMPNLPVSFMFEPGSVLKPITALLAIENKLYEPNDMIDCRDYHLEGRVITDAHEHEFKEISFRDIIAYSSNVGISKIVEKVGSTALYKSLTDLGFGQKTNSNIYGEVGGILRKLKDWQGFSLHSISFGQEISVTALQLTNAYCAVANGGNLLYPSLVEKIVDQNGKNIREFEPIIRQTVSNEKSLDTIKDFLKAVVDYGTASSLKTDLISIAGKTGTAEKAIEGVYSEDKFTSVFTGFFPVENPRYVITVVYDEPDYRSYAYYATLSAVPTFQKIVHQLITLPDDDILTDIVEKNTDYIEMPDLIGKSWKKAEKILRKKDIKYKILGERENSFVANQFPKPEVSFDAEGTVQVIMKNEKQEKQIPEDDQKMPDLTGMTLRKALKLANQKKIKLLIEGKGIIYWQSIPENIKIAFGEICKVKAD